MSLRQSHSYVTRFLIFLSVTRRSLPASFGKLVHLTTFDGSYNHLEHIPDELGNCTQLSSLDVQHNKLTNLPHTIGNLKNLTRLGLRYGTTCP